MPLEYKQNLLYGCLVGMRGGIGAVGIGHVKVGARNRIYCCSSLPLKQRREKSLSK